MRQIYEKSSYVLRKKSEIYENTLKKVSEVTEISVNQILDNEVKEMEVVDARHLLVFSLIKRGLYPATIARMIGISRSTVNRIVSAWSDRCKGCPILTQYLHHINA